jgi:flagellar M-ring protein FliF
MTVSVVVRQALTDAQVARLREVVGLALGFNAQRGDAIVVNSMDRLVSAAAGQGDAGPGVSAHAAAPVPALVASTDGSALQRRSVETVTLVLAGLVVLIALGVLTSMALRRRAAAPLRLDAAARETMLRDVRRWIDVEPVNVAVPGEAR